MNYKEKYIKYKNKYINLKNELNQSGGMVSPTTMAKAAFKNPKAAIALATGNPTAVFEVGKAVLDPKNAGLVGQAVKDVTGSADAAKMATNAAATIQNAATSAKIDPTKIAQQAQQLANPGAALNQVTAAAKAAGTNLAEQAKQQATTAGTNLAQQAQQAKQQATTAGTNLAQQAQQAQQQATTAGTATLNKAQSAVAPAGTKAVAPAGTKAVAPAGTNAVPNINALVSTATNMGTNIIKNALPGTSAK